MRSVFANKEKIPGGLVVFALMFCFFSAYGQNRQYAVALIDTLSSPFFHGRGYVHEGAGRAAAFISDEFSKLGLDSFNEGYFQDFNLSINTFPGEMEVQIDGHKQLPGRDFVVESNSPSINGTFPLYRFLKDSAGAPRAGGDHGMIDISQGFVVTDMDRRDFEGAGFGAAGIVFLEENIWWHVSRAFEVKDYVSVRMLPSAVPESADSITINVENRFFSDYPVSNVIGWLPGNKQPERYMAVTAHYDHLGRMGSKTYFPGAHDNASGVAMMLDLASYFSEPENRPGFSLVFMAFAAEEAGLKGSTHYVENPLFPLEDMRFLINLDMVGSGSDGIMVVNGAVREKEYERMVKINSENEYILTVKKRGEAANSDHHPFHTRGVPAVFIYTLGDECREYHNPDDTPGNVPFTEYEDVFRLIRDFIQSMPADP